MPDNPVDALHSETMGKIDQTIRDHNDALNALSQAQAKKPPGPSIGEMKAQGANTIGLGLGIGKGFSIFGK